MQGNRSSKPDGACCPVRNVWC